MIHIHSRCGRLCAGFLTLALLWSLTACDPASSEDTSPPASPAAAPDGTVVQTVSTQAPAASSPAHTTGDQEDTELPDGEAASPSPDASPAPSAEPTPIKTASVPYSEEALEEKLAGILKSIITDGMTQREQARAVFKYVNNHIRFIGSSDKSDWKKGAYEGLTLGRGDCFTYYAASRALLTALDIDNLEVRRDGGTSDHYWNLVNCGDGWYHFDTCPRRVKMEGFDGFMFTDETAAAYSALREDIPCYYGFDASLYPERAGGAAPEESSAPEGSAVPTAQPLETPVPTSSLPPASPGGEAVPDADSAERVSPPATEIPCPTEPTDTASDPPEDDAAEAPPFISVPPQGSSTPEES